MGCGHALPKEGRGYGLLALCALGHEAEFNVGRQMLLGSLCQNGAVGLPFWRLAVLGGGHVEAAAQISCPFA